MTRNDMIRWINDALWIARMGDHTPNHDAIIAAIEAGLVRPDDNNGAITDPTEQMLFGALISGNPTFWHPVTA